MSQKGRIFREEHHLPGLLTIAQEVHCTVTGSHQPASTESVCLRIQALVVTLADWEPSRSPFEEAVKILCREALTDGRNWLVEQLEHGILSEGHVVQISGLDRIMQDVRC